MTNFPRLLWYLANGQKRVYWGKDKLRKYQEKRLHSIIRNAYEFVPFYHWRFKQAHILPDDIRHLDDLTKLPIVRKRELKSENVRNLISSNYNLAQLKMITTSGSTGQPLQIFLSKTEDDWRKAIYMRANISCGQRPRDHWVALTHPHHFSDTTNLQRRLGIFSQTCISIF
jgi:phenylacetate-CoA ligase